MAALRNFNGLASWRNAKNRLQSVNLTMPRINTLHALASAHLGINRAQMRMDLYASDRWSVEATKMLEHAVALPNNPHFSRYDQLVWKGLTAAWSGDVTPEKAVDTVVHEMRATMADLVVIR